MCFSFLSSPCLDCKMSQKWNKTKLSAETIATQLRDYFKEHGHYPISTESDTLTRRAYWVRDAAKMNELTAQERAYFDALPNWEWDRTAWSNEIKRIKPRKKPGFPSRRYHRGALNLSGEPAHVAARIQKFIAKYNHYPKRSDESKLRQDINLVRMHWALLTPEERAAFEALPDWTMGKWAPTKEPSPAPSTSFALKSMRASPSPARISSPAPSLKSEGIPSLSRLVAAQSPSTKSHLKRPRASPSSPSPSVSEVTSRRRALPSPRASPQTSADLVPLRRSRSLEGATARCGVPWFSHLKLQINVQRVSTRDLAVHLNLAQGGAL